MTKFLSGIIATVFTFFLSTPPSAIAEEFRLSDEEIASCIEAGNNFFAEHYIICTVSAGMDAQANFLVDLKSNTVTKIMDSELGIRVPPDSTVTVIVNPCFRISDGEVPSWLFRKIYTFDPEKGTFYLTGQNQRQSSPGSPECK